MLIFIIFLIVSVVTCVKKRDKNYVFVFFATSLCLSCLIFACGLFFYTEEVPQPKKSTTLKLVEIQPANTNQQYLELKEDSSICFCVEMDNDRQQFKAVDLKKNEVFIEHLESAETPKVEIWEEQTCSKLTRKPSIWIDFLGYIALSKKDIGDVVIYHDSFPGDAPTLTYIFYLPPFEKQAT